MYEFDNENYIKYESGAVFVRRCEICCKFVKPDKTIFTNDEGLKDVPNSTCRTHGRVKMIFTGFF